MKGVLALALLLSSLIFINASTENERCEAIYYFILSYNYQYSQEDFKNLADKLNITIQELEEYRYNYGYLCSNYSSSLPKQQIPVLIVYKNQTECVLNEPSIFKESIPFFKIVLGEKSCKLANFLNFIFKLERNSESYEIVGIKVFTLFVLFIVIILAIFIKDNSRINSLLISFFRKSKQKSETETIKYQ